MQTRQKDENISFYKIFYILKNWVEVSEKNKVTQLFKAINY